MTKNNLADVIRALVDEFKENQDDILSTLGEVIMESTNGAKFILILQLKDEESCRYASSQHFGNPSLNPNKHLDKIVEFISTGK